MSEPAARSARPKISTGIQGLDMILGGGIESERVYLVEGTPGTGKTTLGLAFLLEGVKNGESALYITLSESETELRITAASHGWCLDGLNVFELITEAGLDAEAEQTVLHPSELELGETARAVMAQVQALNPARIVFDSLSEVRLLAQNPQRYRRQVLALKYFFTQRRCTVLLLDDRTSEPSLLSGDLQLHSLAHGVVILEQIPLEFGAERRRLRVVKLRGSRFRGGYHDFTIEPGGLAVYPRLIAHEHHTEFSENPVSSGNPEVDLLLGGGLNPGTNALVMGPSGVGKTTTAVVAMFAGLCRGENAALFLFDEGQATLLARSSALGMDLRPFIAAGQLTIRQIDPAEMSPGEFTHHVRIAVEGHLARYVVIDSLNAYMQSMPGEKFLLLQLHELLTYLNQQGVITIMVLAQHGVVGSMTSAVDLSYLADSIVLLRYFEMDGEVRKAISVVKTRTAKHDRTIRELTVGSAGVTIGAPLRGLRGVLGGLSVWGEEPTILAKPAAALD